MKFNWGVGIAIALTAFITFILSFVYKASQTDTDLTSDDYYEQEINYQPTIVATNNAADLKDEFKYIQTGELYVIKFPEEVKSVNKGNVHFYRPSDDDLDKHYDLTLSSNGEMAVPLDNLKKGYYTIKISWSFDGKDYFVEEEINVE